MESRTGSSSAFRIALTAVIALTVAAGAGAAGGRPFTVCLVTDPAAAGDPAIGASAEAGLQTAERRGTTGRLIRASSPAADLDGLRACVRGGADLTIGVGYLMESAMNSVATAYPHRVFAIVDASVTTLPSRPDNVQGVLFRTEQAGDLAGYAAGLWAKARGGKAVGSVGGLEIPPVDRYVAGFEAGAKRAFPKVRTLRTYAQSLTSVAKCRKSALSQIADGSVVEFQVAGSCGAGVLEAAHAKGVFGIGSDADQGTLGDWIMTSAVKHVDVAVAATIAAARDGTLRPRTNVIYGAAAGGVGRGVWSPLVPSAIRNAVARQAQLLRNGMITGIPTKVD